MSDYPEPLTPPDCDLTDFSFMPLEVGRLRRSKAWVKAKRNPALGFYMVNLWTASWHERPAGSIEDDDDVLADAAMCDPLKWAKVREDVLRGWVKCSDGRLYNQTVCEKVQEAWAAKLERLARDEHERDRKRREREERSSLYAALKERGITMAWNAPMSDVRKAVLNLSAGQVADIPRSHFGLSRLREGEGEGQGEGQGEGEGEGEEEEEIVAAPSGASVADAPATLDPDPAFNPAGPGKAKPDRGRRLPTDWELPKAWGDWTLATFSSWTPDQVRFEADKFADYWRSKAGKDATKTDWLATWRNWCRNAKLSASTPKTIDKTARNVGAMRLLGMSEETIEAALTGATHA